MNIFGIPPGALLRFAREEGDAGRPAGPLLVDGPLAQQLARLLADGGDPGLVRLSGDPAAATAVVCVLAGAPTDAQRALLRAATRVGVATVAVQTAPASDAHVPYVLPEDVVTCPPGSGFPVAEIAAAIARGAPHDAAALAARLPALRAASERVLTVRAAGIAAGLAAAPWVGGSNLPALVLLQARFLRELGIAGGRAAPASQQDLAAAVGQHVGLPLALGVTARGLVRRLPVRSRLVDAAVAGGVTLALGRLGGVLR